MTATASIRSCCPPGCNDTRTSSQKNPTLADPEHWTADVPCVLSSRGSSESSPPSRFTTSRDVVKWSLPIKKQILVEPKLSFWKLDSFFFLFPFFYEDVLLRLRPDRPPDSEASRENSVCHLVNMAACQTILRGSHTRFKPRRELKPFLN